MSKASNLAGFVPSINPTNNLNIGNVTGVAATFTGNVSVGGTLTYEDVTNVDSVGLITARSGIQVTGGSVVVGSAVTLSSGGINVVGVVTASAFVDDGTNLLTEINTKTSTGKAIAMSMIFG